MKQKAKTIPILLMGIFITKLGFFFVFFCDKVLLCVQEFLKGLNQQVYSNTFFVGLAFCLASPH